eukprot:TRINITY_DN9247_c0_g2_i9.p3 TRINITY_DN9247_c0_g2~~TRINITY_DN9247_c0_g2_i9.p3  ORF type:complete len:118 (+),score=30.49 TRINITY_DN9247_c0_g2_i9:744-1097(+)
MLAIKNKIKKYEESKLSPVVDLLKAAEGIVQSLEKVLKHLNNKEENESVSTKEEAKELGYSLVTEKTAPKRDAKVKVISEFTTGHLLLLNCGHNGVLSISELSQYEAHLISAGIIDE